MLCNPAEYSVSQESHMTKFKYILLQISDESVNWDCKVKKRVQKPENKVGMSVHLKRMIQSRS